MSTERGYELSERSMQRSASRHRDDLDSAILDMVQLTKASLPQHLVHSLQPVAGNVPQLDLSRDFTVPDYTFDKASVLFLASIYQANARFASRFLRVDSVLSKSESASALTRNAIREFLNETTSDLLIDLDIFQPQTLSVGDWNLEFDIWEDRLLREFAEVCPTPNTFEELMLADALDMPDEAILYWFEHYRQKRRRLLAAENAGAETMKPRPDLKTQKEISAHMQTLKDKYCFRHALRKVTLKKKASWPEVMHDLV